MTAIDRARRLAAPRACANGIRPLEAGTSVLIGCGCWHHRQLLAANTVSPYLTVGRRRFMPPVPSAPP